MNTTPTDLGELILTDEQLAAHPDAAPYAWIITEDRINDDGSVPSRVGTMGPSNAHPDFCAAVAKPGRHRIRFRMYDDEGTYYYGGFLTFDPDCPAYIEPAWAPVDDFGMPDAGCTQISYPQRPALDCS